MAFHKHGIYSFQVGVRRWVLSVMCPTAGNGGRKLFQSSQAFDKLATPVETLRYFRPPNHIGPIAHTKVTSATIDQKTRLGHTTIGYDSAVLMKAAPCSTCLAVLSRCSGDQRLPFGDAYVGRSSTGT